MDIDFSLVLLVLTLGSGAIWLFDVVFLLPRRKAAAERVSGTGAGGAVEAARQGLLRESLLVEYAASFFPVFLLVLVLRSFLFEPYQIPTGSMIPTLQVGDFILVNKYVYGLRVPVFGHELIPVDKPRTGEIMVFIPPHESRYFIKRVIGGPGDRIRYENKTLYINGQRMEQRLVAKLPADNPSYGVYEENLGGTRHLIHLDLRADHQAQEWVVPEGHYFMMGDNRDRSSDSRYWGFVPERNVRGRATAIWMHKEPGLQLPEFGRNGWVQ